jgi:hypothetical protein
MQKLPGGDTSEVNMSNVAELLERKRTLLDRMQKQSDPERLLETQHELQEIDESLNRIEADKLDAPIAPK